MVIFHYCNEIDHRRLTTETNVTTNNTIDKKSVVPNNCSLFLHFKTAGTEIKKNI